MITRKTVVTLSVVCIFILCLSGCSKSESESYLEFLQEQGVTDNSQNHWQNTQNDSVQISSRGTFLRRISDKALYQIENEGHKKIADEAYDFFEFRGKVYYYNKNNLYCYDTETEKTTVLIAVPADILWIGLYDENILCARWNETYNIVLERYALDGKRMKKYFEWRGTLGRMTHIGKYVVFLKDLRVVAYDLENGEKHYLIDDEGLSDSFMVAGQENLYISLGRYTIDGNYNNISIDSRWNGLWKISLDDMERDKWNLTKISDRSYSKFYCVENRLYDEEFKPVDKK